jgi:protein farnesyltransferase subunit beta
MFAPDRPPPPVAALKMAGAASTGEDPAVESAEVVDATRSVPSRAELTAFRRAATPNQGVVTQTWYQQRDVEQQVFLLQRCVPHGPGIPPPPLRRESHLRFATAGLSRVSPCYAGLHASQPWLLYWMLHAIDLLGGTPPPAVADVAVQHLRACRDGRSGGFGGGPGQDAHLASTYAATAALLVVGTRDAYDAIRPAELRRFLGSLKCADGGFLISASGEKDVRALYSALASASMAGVLDDELVAGVGPYVRSLQSFDGGLGGEPGIEAHGGNTFCGVAAAALAGALSELDAEAIVDWAAMRQCRVEGGFCGRTNKLVDSCYSFWVGALFPILDAPRAFNAEALQRYILVCCQDDGGGLRDKPGVSGDFHHTCYALSGLSVAQHYGGAVPPGDESAVRKVDVLHNVCDGRLQAAREYLRAAAGDG